MKTKLYNELKKYIVSLFYYIISQVKEKVTKDIKSKVGEYTSWVIDLPDTRDYIYSELWGALQSIPVNKLLSDKEIQDQSLQDETRYWCVFYWTSTCSNTLSHTKLGDRYISWYDLTMDAKREWMLYDFWAYLIDWPKLAKERWLIDMYSKVTTLMDMKDAIANWNPILTWSKKIDWKASDNKPFKAIRWTWYAHCFAIVWYDDRINSFIIEQSYGNTKFYNWYMYLDYKDIDLLFSKYVLHLNDTNVSTFKSYQEEIKELTLDEAYTKYILLDGEQEKKLFRYAMQLKFIWKINE